jgi:hypothetical protein
MIVGASLNIVVEWLALVLVINAVQCWFCRWVNKLQKAVISFVMLVYLFMYMEQLVSFWIDFHET